MGSELKIPWATKYRPRNLAEVVDQEEAKAKVLEWLKRWPKVEKKALLLYGPPGCGKTSLVEAVASELGYELIEMNASDYRRKEDVERVAIRAAVASSIFSAEGKKILLLDEVDGIADKEDAGALDALKRLVSLSKAPVIMTANNPWDQRLRVLRELAEFVELKKLGKRDVSLVLKKICNAERLRCEEDALELIAERAEGDLRAAINDLQAVGEGYGAVTAELVKTLLRPRIKERDPFETLRAIFSANYCWQAKEALDQSQLDYEQLKLWLAENLPHQYTDPEDLYRAYEALSKADVHLGRIVKRGDWDLLSYAIEMMTAGIAMAAKNNRRDKYRWVKYSFPERLRMMSKLKDVRNLRDDVAHLVALYAHVSTSTAKTELIPILRAIMVSNPEMGARLALGLGLSEKMVEFLAGPKKAEVLAYYRRYKEALTKRAQQTKPSKSETTRAPKGERSKSGGLLSFAKK